MQLRVAEMISKGGGSVREYFQTAFLWKFNRRYHCAFDVSEYVLFQKIPKYVVEYTDHLLRGSANE